MNDLLPISVLTFGMIVVITEMILLYKARVIASDKAIHLLGITLVLITILFMLTSSVKLEFATPVVGLLGTIVGYVAGKQTEETMPEQAGPSPADDDDGEET